MGFGFSYREYFVDINPDNCTDDLTGVPNGRGISEYIFRPIEKGRPLPPRAFRAYNEVRRRYGQKI